MLRTLSGDNQSEKSEFVEVNTETFCSAEVYGLNKSSIYHPNEEDWVKTPADPVCEVFVEHEIEGLSMSHFHVTVYANYGVKSGVFGNLVEPEVVYRYDPSGFYKNTDGDIITGGQNVALDHDV